MCKLYSYCGSPIPRKMMFLFWWLLCTCVVFTYGTQSSILGLVLYAVGLPTPDHSGQQQKKMATVPCIHDIFCRLAPAAASAASANPYLQSMYAAMAGQASNPYAQLQGTGLISLAQAQNQLISQAATPAQAGTTGNPLLDAYGQYAAQLAAAQQVYTTTANQQQLTASTAIDAQASKFFAIPYIINVG